METVLKAIADWIKGILTAGIMSNLSGLFDDVNTQVGNIAQQVGTKPSSFEPRVFAMIEQLLSQIRSRTSADKSCQKIQIISCGSKNHKNKANEKDQSTSQVLGYYQDHHMGSRNDRRQNDSLEGDIFPQRSRQKEQGEEGEKEFEKIAFFQVFEFFHLVLPHKN